MGSTEWDANALTGNPAFDNATSIFIRTINTDDLHKILLKIGAPIILLRNLDALNEFVNKPKQYHVQI